MFFELGFNFGSNLKVALRPGWLDCMNLTPFEYREENFIGQLLNISRDCRFLENKNKIIILSDLVPKIN